MNDSEIGAIVRAALDRLSESVTGMPKGRLELDRVVAITVEGVLGPGEVQARVNYTLKWVYEIEVSPCG